MHVGGPAPVQPCLLSPAITQEGHSRWSGASLKATLDAERLATELSEEAEPSSFLDRLSESPAVLEPSCQEWKALPTQPGKKLLVEERSPLLASCSL